MQVARYFTQEGASPYEGINFVARTSEIKKLDGSHVFRMENVIVPETWGQAETDVLAQKYFRRRGCNHEFSSSVNHSSFSAGRIQVDAQGDFETDLRQTVHRMVGCWTAWGKSYGYFNTPADAQAFYDELSYMIATQMAAPNSPQWFNTGLNWAYGISGQAQGHYYVDPATQSLKRSTDAYTRPQPHACFIQSVDDDLVNQGGIMDLFTREARVFKYGSGSGTNYSSIRGAGESLSGGGKSSGLLSFLQVGDRAAGAIKSGGTTRRSARMVCLDVDHPDVEEFIDWKVGEERKVAMLAMGSAALARSWDAMCTAVESNNGITDLKANTELRQAIRDAQKAGIPAGLMSQCLSRLNQGDFDRDIKVFDSAWDGEAYASVSGMNSNNSVRLSAAFMQAVEAGSDWNLVARTTGQVTKTIPARALWRKINYAAWACADPGVQFDTTINEWHTASKSGPINASNPCCFVGETLVDTSEGRIPMNVLAHMASTGRDLPFAYSFDFTQGLPVLRQITNAWKAGVTTKLVRVTTQRGYTFLCTPEHRFYLHGGEAVEAQHLTPGSRLRKIARWANDARSGRMHLNHKTTASVPNGTSIQARWVWEQVNGPIAPGYEVHHINEDPTDDRLSNLTLVIKSSHVSDHSRGDQNSRFIKAEPHVLVDVWEAIERIPRTTHKDGPAVTVARWNAYIKANCLEGRVPLANMHIQGMTWNEFAQWIEEQKCAVNDRVASVEIVDLAEPVEVFDIEVEGVHNFGILQEREGVHHSVIVSNSEFMFLDDTSCNLASLNLCQFLGEDGTFDVDGYQHAIRLWTMVLEISVLMAQFPSVKIAQNSYDFRPLGLGYANLGGLLMRLGIAYDSPKGRGYCAGLTAVLTGCAYATSAEMAKEVGPFPGYAENKEAMLSVIDNHKRAIDGHEVLGVSVQPSLEYDHIPSVLLIMAQEMWRVAKDLGAQFGYRNAQVSVLAPTGTIGILMGCDTTGVEPDFALVKFKKLAGGGYMKLVNGALPEALKRLGYSQSRIRDIVEYVQGEPIRSGHTAGIALRDLRAAGYPDTTIAAWDEALASAFDPRFVLPVDELVEKFGQKRTEEFLLDVGGRSTVEGAPHLSPEHYSVFDCANKCGRYGTRFIDPMGHLSMMAAAQPFLSGAISKTVNLPADYTVDQIGEVYMQAWKLMLKAVALYRDGSKLSQAMATNLDMLDGLDVLQDEEASIPEKVEAVAQALVPVVIGRPQRRRMPNRRGGYTQSARIGDTKIYLRTGEYEDGTLGEIFLDGYKEGAAFKAILNALAVAVSMGLQYGVPLEEFCDAFLFTKFEPNGIVRDHAAVKTCTSIIDLIFRDLAISYLHRYELAHIAPEDLISEVGQRKPLSVPRSFGQAYGQTPAADEVVTEAELATHAAKKPTDQVTESRLKGFTGDPCPTCGHLTLVRNGACTKCTTCGSTTGCS